MQYGQIKHNPNTGQVLEHDQTLEKQRKTRAREQDGRDSTLNACDMEAVVNVKDRPEFTCPTGQGCSFIPGDL
jgi:hypothetical protein